MQMKTEKNTPEDSVWLNVLKSAPRGNTTSTILKAVFHFSIHRILLRDLER